MKAINLTLIDIPAKFADNLTHGKKDIQGFAALRLSNVQKPKLHNLKKQDEHR